jgi:hypothetical protein
MTGRTSPSGPSAAAAAAWAACRYRWLLPWSARSRRAARRYARIVGRVELLRDRARRARARERITRWLGCPPAEADRLYRASLTSEAQEEADSAWCMRHPHAWAETFRPPRDEPAAHGPTIYVTLHFGSPILAYLYLRCRRGLDVRVIVRPLSAANPMPAAKRAFAERKLAWVAAAAGDAPLATDGAGTACARDHLVGGGSLFAAVDVPGDVVSRAAVVAPFGERILVSSGMVTLARLTGASLQPIVAVRRGDALALRYGTNIPAGVDAATLAMTFRELGTFIADDPGEWWLWPYVVTPPAADATP